MLNFEFTSPTKIYFGKGQEEQIGKILQSYGYHKILLHYGTKAIFQNGLYEKIINSLENAHICYVELGGVLPNPKIDLVREGVKLVKKENIQLILAVGGGSVIDSAKAIAVGAMVDFDPWLFNAHEKTPNKALPVGAILTISAAGSELSNSCVITNPKIKCKNGFNSDVIRPKFAIMNPELTYTVSPHQTACGIVDIMMHTLERYFSDVDDLIFTDEIAIGLLKAVLKAAKRVINNPTDYNARSALMIASSFSHNGLTGLGSRMYFTVHKIEHIISGIHDEVAHAEGLSVLFGAWALYTKELFIAKWEKLGQSLFDLPKSADLVDQTINSFINFFKTLKMPTSFKDLKITKDEFILFASLATNNKTTKIVGVKELGYDDLIQIFNLAK